MEQTLIPISKKLRGRLNIAKAIHEFKTYEELLTYYYELDNNLNKLLEDAKQ